MPYIPYLGSRVEITPPSATRVLEKSWTLENPACICKTDQHPCDAADLKMSREEDVVQQNLGLPLSWVYYRHIMDISCLEP
jgi:hypothetical protein